jgi:hypothetical protein
MHVEATGIQANLFPWNEEEPGQLALDPSMNRGAMVAQTTRSLGPGSAMISRSIGPLFP